MGMGRTGVRFLGEGREWRLLGLVYAEDLVFYDESEKVRLYNVEVCKRRGLILGVYGMQLLHVSEYKYLGFV